MEGRMGGGEGGCKKRDVAVVGGRGGGVAISPRSLIMKVNSFDSEE